VILTSDGSMGNVVLSSIVHVHDYKFKPNSKIQSGPPAGREPGKAKSAIIY
jgi:hypothetical protein